MELEGLGSASSISRRERLRSRKYQEQRRKTSNAFYGETESHQYEGDESEVWKHHQLQRFYLCFVALSELILFFMFRHYEDRGRLWTFSKKSEVRRWTLTLLTGMFTGAVAVFVTFFTKFLTNYKLTVFYNLIELEKSGDIRFGIAFLFLLSFNVFLGMLAWCTVWAEPLAAGSGKAEIVVSIFVVLFICISMLLRCSLLLFCHSPYSWIR